MLLAKNIVGAVEQVFSLKTTPRLELVGDEHPSACRIENIALNDAMILSTMRIQTGWNCRIRDNQIIETVSSDAVDLESVIGTGLIGKTGIFAQRMSPFNCKRDNL
jgi:hypothetical protein